MAPEMGLGWWRSFAAGLAAISFCIALAPPADARQLTLFPHKDETRCPPENFNSVGNFSVENYTASPWYVYSQMPTSEQPVEDLFCVTITYDMVAPDEFSVRRNGNSGSVNGPVTGEGVVSDLLARIPNLDNPSEFVVGGAFLPPIRPFVKSFWVVAVGSDYEWAVATAGMPSAVGDTPGTCYNGCSGGFGGCRSLFSNGEGMWLLTREPTPTQEVVDDAQDAMEDLGLDLSKLVVVEQEGCMYEEAFTLPPE
eukprot:CAMPEP_0117677512 /NCGR_PEP_ID=MMETSP0804-20121206/16784_1 /TAXON_ID=1074897 /ORGANISM="Tetraselmis astigmatica, Strain CCMP880" /LENGTH=252 /DNA_ID=CAMNT_0005486799 /DNA_START=150 /DNA_END=908 /DNA_ORIENTATION=-